MEALFVICGFTVLDEWNVSTAVGRLSLSKGEGEGEGSSRPTWRHRLFLSPWQKGRGEQGQKATDRFAY
jgi:hypothetical protein